MLPKEGQPQAESNGGMAESNPCRAWTGQEAGLTEMCDSTGMGSPGAGAAATLKKAIWGQGLARSAG